MYFSHFLIIDCKSKKTSERVAVNAVPVRIGGHAEGAVALLTTAAATEKRTGVAGDLVAGDGNVGRYPDNYYEFMSTKFRLNVALGQRVTWQIPANKRKYAKSVSLFYEVGSCDLYIRSKFLEHSVPMKDILGLSIGIKIQML